MILEQPVLGFFFNVELRTWKIKLFPNSVSKTAITSIQLKRLRIDSSCSLFNVKPRTYSLSLNTRFKSFHIFCHCLCHAGTNKKHFGRKFVTCQ